MEDEFLLTGPSTVDPAFLALKMEVPEAQIVGALEELAAKQLLTVVLRWRCFSCQNENVCDEPECSVCGATRRSMDAEYKSFLRVHRQPERDPSAVFLVHGMNTLGAWQESFAWRIQLLYSYPLPVFVFKYGKDRRSPFFEFSQRRRTRQLAAAIEQVQDDLRRSGKNQRCDVIAHSFGTLLVARLLTDPKFRQIQLGRVVLTGSLIPRDYDWAAVMEDGRVESFLNHRAGRDFWVRAAPWFCPNVGSSGVYGFIDAQHGTSALSPDFGHSDYFVAGNYEGVIRRLWSPFFAAAAAPAPMGAASKTPEPPLWVDMPRLYWLGRPLLLFFVVVIALTGLKVIAVVGTGAQWVLRFLGL